MASGTDAPEDALRSQSGALALLGRHGTRNTWWDAVILYVLLVAALNLGLGFGVAVYLGRRYRAVVGTDDPWDPDALLGQSVEGALAGEEHTAAGVETSPDRPPEKQAAEPTADATENQPSHTTTDPQPDETPAAHSPTSPQPDDDPGQKSVEDLRGGAQRYHEQVTRADEKLRACAETPDAAEIEGVLGSLMDSTQQYLEDRNQAHGTFNLVQQGQPESGGICDDLQAAIEREDQQIEGTSAMIEGFDYQSDLGEGCRRMSEETGKLIGSIVQLRETLDEVKAKLAGGEQQPQQADPATPSDTPKESSGRTDLKAELLKLLDQQSDQTPYLSVAMIELDEFVQLKQQHGRQVADKILRAVTQLLKSEKAGEDSFSELPQQRFFLRSPEADTRLAANTAERLRQTIEKAHLHHDKSEIRVTISCAVVGTASEEAPEGLIERAEATLQEAKRYGCNRTFMHDGKYPTPVVPPNFSLEEKQVTL